MAAEDEGQRRQQLLRAIGEALLLANQRLAGLAMQQMTSRQAPLTPHQPAGLVGVQPRTLLLIDFHAHGVAHHPVEEPARIEKGFTQPAELDAEPIGQVALLPPQPVDGDQRHRLRLT